MQRLRVGIVGCGEVTQIMHLPSLHQLAEQFAVTALCDVSDIVLQAVGDQWRVAKRYHDYHDPNPKIYYTTDGSAPTTSSPFFMGSGQIRFDTRGTQTLKYFAQNAAGNPTSVETKTYELAVANVRPIIKVQDGDPQPGAHRGAVTITIEAVDDRDAHVTVHYTRDGSLPDDHAPAFQDRHRFEFAEPGQHIVACYAQDSDGNETYETFCYALTA